MLALLNYRVFQTVLSKQAILPNISVQCLRSLSSIQQEVKLNDMPSQMENPYKQPQKGCILCNVSVDYKNVQVCVVANRGGDEAIKRARSMGFMSVTLKDPQFIKDPNVCDIRHMD